MRIGLVLAGILSLLLTACGPSADRTVQAEVVRSSGALSVKNTGVVSLRDCKVELNAGFFSSGYYDEVGEIPAGEERRILFGRFATADGAPFNPTAMRLRTVHLSCRWTDTSHLALADYAFD